MFLFIYFSFACFWFAKAAASIQNYCLSPSLRAQPWPRDFLSRFCLSFGCQKALCKSFKGQRTCCTLSFRRVFFRDSHAIIFENASKVWVKCQSKLIESQICWQPKVAFAKLLRVNELVCSSKRETDKVFELHFLQTQPKNSPPMKVNSLRRCACDYCMMIIISSSHFFPLKCKVKL